MSVNFNKRVGPALYNVEQKIYKNGTKVELSKMLKYKSKPMVNSGVCKEVYLSSTSPLYKAGIRKFLKFSDVADSIRAVGKDGKVLAFGKDMVKKLIKCIK